MKITTIKTDLNRPIPPEVSEANISKYEPPSTPKKPTKKPKIRSIQGPYLEKMFYQNEIDAYMHRSKTGQELQRKFLTAYKNDYKLRLRFKNYKQSIGNLRTQYNRCKLYTQQSSVYLLSFNYGDAGLIVVDGRHYYKYLSFKEAYNRCVDFKVADPRFILPETIQKIRDLKNSENPEFVQWSIPSPEWTETFCNDLTKLLQTQNKPEYRLSYNPSTIYDSVHFPPGWTSKDQ